MRTGCTVLGSTRKKQVVRYGNPADGGAASPGVVSADDNKNYTK